jgi:hypothetical protein
MRRPALTLALVAPLVVAAVYLGGALHWYRPFLDQRHPVVASTPSLEGLYSVKEVRLRHGQRACIQPLPLDPEVHRLRLMLWAHATRAVPLSFVLRGRGYTARGRFTGYPAGGQTPVIAPVNPAPPAAFDGQLCVRNEGRHSVGLVGTDEPDSLTLPSTSVDGQAPGPVDPAVTFYGGPDASLLSRTGTVIGRVSDFTGGVMPVWLLWPLALLIVIGVPAGTAVALGLALRETS